MQLILLLVALVLPPTTRPTSRPATSPAADAAQLQLLGGQVHLTLPPEWKVIESSDSGIIAQRRVDAASAKFTLNAIKQRSAMPASASKALVDGVIKSIRKRAAESGSEIVTEPAMGDDMRFFAMVTARTRNAGKTADRMYAYRQEGLLMLTIACDVPTDKQEIAQAFHKQVADMLASATVQTDEPVIGGGEIKKPAADAPGPTLLPKAKLRIDSPPAGWRSRKTDAASGTVLTYRELGGENGLIIVSVRPLPPEAKSDPKLRDALIEELLAGEKSALEIPGAKETEKPHTVSDARFLRKTVQKYDVQGAACQVVSRQLVVGNALLSVASFATDERAAETEKLADTVAISAKSTGR